MKTITRSPLLLLSLLALVAAACDVGSTASTSTTLAMTDTMIMNMGDPDATPAEDMLGADLVEGSFVLLDTRPPGYDQVSGTAALATHEAGTTVTLRMEGLTAGVDYISHVHAGTCAASGGDHFKFDPEGSNMPPNEIHLAFTARADGSGFMTAENEQAATGAGSVVVHPVSDLDAKLACAEFGG